MPAGEALEDDYIVSLLKRDADVHQKRYSTLTSTNPVPTPSTRRPDAPKPNTRFLKSILRETDSHNAALKTKEGEESRARLRELRGGKRKRGDRADGGENEVKRKKERAGRPGRWASALGLDGTGEGKGHKVRRGEEGRLTREEVKPGAGGSHRYRHQNEHRVDPPSHRKHRSSRGEKREEASERSRSPHHRREHRRRHRSTSASRKDAKDSDTDPLTEFLGGDPPPATLPRGRGAFKPSSMDIRFRDDYDPTSDAALDADEEDNWDMALEALKARTKWRAQGADRLRAAGFTEEEVGRWEKSGNAGEGNVEDVRWRKKGEGREWDRGKVADGVEDGDADGDGMVKVKAEWAR